MLKLGHTPKFGLINSTEASRSNRAQTSPRRPRKRKRGLVLVFWTCAKTNVNEQTIVLHTLHVPVGYRGITIYTFDQRRCSFSEDLGFGSKTGHRADLQHPKSSPWPHGHWSNWATNLKLQDDACSCHWNKRNCPETCSDVCRIIEFNKCLINV